MMYKKIFTKPLAFALRKLGYRIIKVEPNYKFPQYDVYTFEVSGNFYADFTRLSAALKNK